MTPTLLNCGFGSLEKKFLGLFLSVRWMFYILRQFQFVFFCFVLFFVTVHSKKALGLRMSVFCWVHEDQLFFSSCLLVWCSDTVYIHNVHECIGFAWTVIRVISSYTEGDGSHSPLWAQYCSRWTVWHCQSMLLFCIVFMKLAPFQFSLKEIQKKRKKTKTAAGFSCLF